jgi:hypothetical protein
MLFEEIIPVYCLIPDFQIIRNAPDVVVKWLRLLFRIREDPASILGPGDRLSWLSFRDFPKLLQANARIVP